MKFIEMKNLMMDRIEFHDTTFLGIEQNKSVVGIRLEAYVHRWEQIGESWLGTGWIEPVLIRLIRTDQIVDSLPSANLAGGSIRTEQELFENMVPLPFRSSGPATLQLEFDTGELSEWTAVQIVIESAGAGRFVENLPDAFLPSE